MPTRDVSFQWVDLSRNHWRSSAHLGQNKKINDPRLSWKRLWEESDDSPLIIGAIEVDSCFVWSWELLSPCRGNPTFSPSKVSRSATNPLQPEQKAWSALLQTHWLFCEEKLLNWTKGPSGWFAIWKNYSLLTPYTILLSGSGSFVKSFLLSPRSQGNQKKRPKENKKCQRNPKKGLETPQKQK